MQQIRAPTLAFEKPFQKTFSKRVAWPFSAAVVGRQKTTMTPRTQKKKKEKPEERGDGGERSVALSAPRPHCVRAG